MQADTSSPQHRPRLASMGRVTITAKGSNMTTQQQTERDDALMRVAELAEELIQTGLRNDGHALCVIEKPDKSDPHYRLCAALDELRALRGDVPAKPSEWLGKRVTSDPDDYDVEYDADYDLGHCANCDGEGFVYGCSWGWQCDTYDEGEGTCLCTRRCDWCNPAKPTKQDEELRALLGEMLRQDTPA